MASTSSPSSASSSDPTDRCSSSGSGSHRTPKHHEYGTPAASHAVDERIDLQPGEEVDCADERKSSCDDISDLDWTDAHAASQAQSLGVSREYIWTLIRRFNYLVFRVRVVDERPLSGLDMEITKDEKTSPEKLQANLTRLYTTVLISLFTFWKHMARLYFWGEPRRTFAFLFMYGMAWANGLLAPTFFIFLTVMAIYPASRSICFPPIPPSIISTTTGGIQKPPAGVVASFESVTGAPENHQGEAVELEAHSFVSSLFKLIMRITTDTTSDDGTPEDGPIPGLAKISGKFIDAKGRTDDKGKAPDNDKTKEPMKHAVEDFEIQPLFDMLFDFIDTWERFANALNPSPPFPAYRSRLFLAAILLLATSSTYYLSRDAMIKSIQFGIGFVLFSYPVVHRGSRFLDYYYPSWRNYCQLRSTILKRVPTNAQLAISLLRASEQIKSPLTPPPVSHSQTITEPVIAAKDLTYLGSTEEQIRETIEPVSPHREPNTNIERNPKLLEQLMGAFKRSSKLGVHIFHKVEKKRASHGSGHAQERLDIGKTTGEKAGSAGPLRFPARYKDTVGYVYIDTAAITPSVSWSSHKKTLETAWTITIADIKDISKIHGMSLKTRHFIRWALDKDVVNGLILKTLDDETFHLSEVVKRDELFNRLISLEKQTWELY